MKRLAVLVLVIACVIARAIARADCRCAARTPPAPTKAEKPARRKPKKQRQTERGQIIRDEPVWPERCRAAIPMNRRRQKSTADEAFFDSTKNMGIFSGRVKVTDPRFNLQSDKLTVFITKGENQGLEKAIAEGNVGLGARPARSERWPADARSWSLRQSDLHSRDWRC